MKDEQKRAAGEETPDPEAAEVNGAPDQTEGAGDLGSGEHDAGDLAEVEREDDGPARD